jgi:hypothetical protein
VRAPDTAGNWESCRRQRLPPTTGVSPQRNFTVSLKWFLWHGNVFRALQVIEDLEIDLDVEWASSEQRKLLKAVTEFGGYLRANGAWLPNYGERYRAGEPISSAFVESAVNQVVSKRMVKQQQMR